MSIWRCYVGLVLPTCVLLHIRTAAHTYFVHLPTGPGSKRTESERQVRGILPAGSSCGMRTGRSRRQHFRSRASNTGELSCRGRECVPCLVHYVTQFTEKILASKHTHLLSRLRGLSAGWHYRLPPPDSPTPANMFPSGSHPVPVIHLDESSLSLSESGHGGHRPPTCAMIRPRMSSNT